MFAFLGVISIGCSKAPDDKKPSSAAQGAAANDGAVKIASMGPLTGDLAYIGENMLAAAQIAVEEINKAGGIKGAKLELVVEDSKCDPKEAVTAGNKLINVDKVSVVIGGLCSSETLALAPIAEKSKVVLFSAASTNPKITEAGDYIFRDVPSDAFQGVYAAQYVKNTLKINRVALLKTLTDWGLGVNDAFKAEFIKLGGTITAEESFPMDSRDIRGQIVKIKESSPELIYFVSYTEGAIVGIRQLRELGVKVQIFGADAWSDLNIWESVKTDGDGTMYLEPENKSYPQTFIDAMNAKTGGKAINVYAPRTYDAVKMIASVIEKVGNDPTAIKNALYQVKDYQGVADNYTFDGNGDILNARYAVRMYKSGKTTFVK